MCHKSEPESLKRSTLYSGRSDNGEERSPPETLVSLSPPPLSLLIYFIELKKIF